MIIALDFDDTHTKDPALWNRFIDDAHRSGHRVVIATMRYNHEAQCVFDTVKGIERADMFSRAASPSARTSQPWASSWTSGLMTTRIG